MKEKLKKLKESKFVGYISSASRLAGDKASKLYNSSASQKARSSTKNGLRKGRIKLATFIMPSDA